MMPDRLSRRSVVATALAGVAARMSVAAQSSNAVNFSLPIGLPGNVAGDRFFIRHGYACENSWYNPGSWHTGEDWYLIDGDTAGAENATGAPRWYSSVPFRWRSTSAGLNATPA